VDATVSPTVAKFYGVQGYPTLFWIRNEVHHPYEGPRTKDGIIDWITERM
jgi:hypothetical protein